VHDFTALPDQSSVLSWVDAERGVGRGRARRLLARGVWQSPHPHVLVTHNGPLSGRERTLSALLGCPPGSVLGGWSALAFDGMPDWWDRQPWILIKDGARKPVLAGIRIVHSAALGPDDVRWDRRPPRTRPARSLVDVASAAQSPGAARLTLIRGMQQGLTTPEQLGLVLARRGQCRHLAILRETVLDLEGGVRSLPERDFARLVRAAGLPDPQRQSVVRGKDGRYYLDADWPVARLAAEVHGRHHLVVETLESDWNRHNDLTIGGRRVLHFTSYAVRRNRQLVIAQLQAAWPSRPQ
jgi:very-short-patch-repair endonuclease